jgi:hypothetical protein
VEKTVNTLLIGVNFTTIKEGRRFRTRVFPQQATTTRVMKKFIILSVFLNYLCLSQAQVFISEMHSESNPSDDKFIELYNAGCSDISLSGWQLTVVSNLGDATQSHEVFTFGSLDTIHASSTFLIGSDFTTITVDMGGFNSGNTTYTNFNGQERDGAVLSDGTSIIDSAVASSSSTDLYQNASISRNSTICSGNSVFSTAEWAYPSTSSPGTHLNNCGGTPPTVTIIGASSTCYNSPPNAYFGSVSPTYPGIWSGPGMTGGQFDPTQVSPGFYWIYYTVEYSPGCFAVDSHQVEVKDVVITLSISEPDTLCPYDLDTISYSPLGTFSGAITNPILNAQSLGSGDHSFTFTGTANGCSRSVTRNIHIMDTVAFSWVHDTIVCYHGDEILIQVSPTGGTLFGPGITGNFFYPDSVNDGIQTIGYEYYDANNCPNYGYSDITVLPDPGLNFSISDTICMYAPIYGQALDPPGAVLSGNGVTGSTFSPSAAGFGTHYLTITYTEAASGCSFQEIQSVHIQDTMNAGSGTTLSPCTNAGMVDLENHLSGNDPGGNWYTPGDSLITNTLIPTSDLINGSYYYVVGNSCGNDTAFINVLITNPVTVNAGPDINIYAGNTATFSNATITGGSSPYTISWSPSTQLVSSTIQNPTTLPLNTTTTFVVYVNDAQGCQDTSTITVIVAPQALSASAQNLDPVICFGDSADLVASYLGGSGPIVFNWSDPAFLTDATSATPQAFPINSGYFYVTVSDDVGQIVDSVYVDVVNSTPVTLSPLPDFCIDDASMDLSSYASPSNGSGGTGIFGPGSLITTNGVFWPLSAGPGNHEIVYTFTDTNACVRRDTQYIQVDTLPLVSLAAFPSYCTSAGTITLTGGSPMGGVYTGTGVTGNTINATTQGSGTYPINYNYTDPNTGCSASAVQDLVINNGPSVQLNIPSSQSIACSGDTAYIITGASPAGGQYSGAGVFNGYFNPDSAGLGTASIVYAYTDANGCSGSAVDFISVLQSPAVQIGNLTDKCVNDNPASITGSQPNNTGTYSGPGILGSTFYPSAAGVGTHTIVYSYTDLFGCSGVDSTTIEVLGVPNVSMGSLSANCLTDPSYSLTVGTPAGGVYSGNGVSGSSFFPNLAGTGQHEIMYTLTDTNGCSNSAVDTVTVLGAPGLYFPTMPNVCENSAPISLSQGIPSGGSYGGAGVTNNSFDPSVVGPGIHQLSYAFTDTLGCGDTVYSNIQVVAKPSITFNNPPDICSNDGPTPIATAMPSGGTYYGTGINSAILDPAVSGAGTFTIYYDYTNAATGCSNSDSASVVVHPLLTVTHPAVSPLCFDANPIILGGGSPAGGVYTGQGISGSTFDPGTAGSGSANILYSYTDSNGCSDETTITILVYTPPTTSFSPPSGVCTDAAPIVLSTGSPGGGTYFGNGVVLGIFDPAANGPGIFDLYYAYTDANGFRKFDPGVQCYSGLSRSRNTGL